MLFGASSSASRKKSHFSFDWWEWWRHCNYYVSDYYIISWYGVWEMRMKRLHVSKQCRHLLWIFIRWSHFTLSVSFSHLFNRHTHIYPDAHLITHYSISIQQESADNEPIYCYCIGFFAPYIVYKLRARDATKANRKN